MTESVSRDLRSAARRLIAAGVCACRLRDLLAPFPFLHPPLFFTAFIGLPAFPLCFTHMASPSPAPAPAPGGPSPAVGPAQFVGALISLISKSDIRYQGILSSIDPDKATISLEQGQLVPQYRDF